MIQQVKAQITKAFVNFSKKDGLPMQEMRVRLTIFNEKLNYYLLHNKEEVRKTDLTEMVGFTYALLAEGKLTDSVKKTIIENNVNESTANVRLYLLKDDSPAAYLFDAGKPIKQIDIDKLIN